MREQIADDGCLIADHMGLSFIRTLSAGEKVALLPPSGQDGMTPSDRHNFLITPLMIEATDRQDETVYLAVTIAYIAEGRDAEVAIHTADHLARLTGHPARPVVAARLISDWLAEMVEADQVLWHELNHSFLERIERSPETPEQRALNDAATARLIALKREGKIP